MAKRGRPANLIDDLTKGVEREKWVREFKGYDDNTTVVWTHDFNKYKNGPLSVEVKGGATYKVEIVKSQKYVPLPVVMVFRTSNRSNANVKMKIWNNTNIDYIISLADIPGVPAKAEILELAVGNKCIEKFKKKYDIK